jgi:hypothetical protein
MTDNQDWAYEIAGEILGWLPDDPRIERVAAALRRAYSDGACDACDALDGELDSLERNRKEL